MHLCPSSICDGLAPAFANIPGLLTEVWLADAVTNTYGGAYTWQNQEALSLAAPTKLITDPRHGFDRVRLVAQFLAQRPYDTVHNVTTPVIAITPHLV